MAGGAPEAVTKVTLVGGTYHFDGEPDASEWSHPDSPFSRYLLSHNICSLDAADGFVWDGALDGWINWPWKRAKTKHLIWRAAGINLRRYLKYTPVEDRNIIAHSHGGQCLWWAAMGFQFNRVILVSTPVRKDMEAVMKVAIQNIRTPLMAVHSDWSDRTQIFGTLFDGALRIERRVLLPGVINVGLPGVGHSDMLTHPDRFDLWQEHGLLAFLKGEV